jgi:hypothetical protein
MLEETVARLSAHLAALRRLVDEAAGRFVSTSRLDAKLALADQLHDDTHAEQAVARRIAELGAEPVAADPDSDLREALRDHIARIDPLVDEPTLRILTEVLAHQERHAADRDATRHEQQPGEPSEELVPRLIAQRIEVADRAAQDIAAATGDRRAALARRCWDAMRHAAALERIAPWPGAASGPAVDPAQMDLPGHEELLEHMRADDARAAGL